jgi:hypothetical protein
MRPKLTPPTPAARHFLFLKELEFAKTASKAETDGDLNKKGIF